MSGISSSVGLVSGINTAQLIDQLMSLEKRPINSLQNRITTMDAQRTAWMTISATLLGMKASLTNFGQASTFRAAAAASSDTSILTASASSTAAVGSYEFTVRRLVQTHQMISGGFSSNTAPLKPGTLAFESTGALLNPPTDLDFLNGQQGVQRGTIRLTDRSGATTDISLIDAVTLTDVMDAINNNGVVAINARVNGDKLELTDATGLATGVIRVSDVGTGRAAADLGIAGSATDAPLIGSSINYITRDTSLDLLNGRTGIERALGVKDIDFTLRDGSQFSVNLYGSVIGDGQTTNYTAHTVGDVIDRINNAEGNDGKLRAELSADGKGIALVDLTGGGGELIVADAQNSRAATQLGIAGSHSADQVQGRPLIASLNSVLLGSLNGGNSVPPGTLHLQDRSGASANIDISAATSVHDIIRAINDAGLNLAASLNNSGTGLKITDSTVGGSANLIISDDTGLMAQLGLAIDDAVSHVDGTHAGNRYISTQTKLEDLNQGRGITRGTFTIVSSTKGEATIDLSGENIKRLDDVIRLINSRDIGVTARINDTGSGILLVDENDGGNPLTVKEIAGGSTARELGLLGSAKEGENFIDGSFRRTIEIEEGDTLQKLADKINNAGLGVSAGIINAGATTNPYRLVLTSDGSGSQGRMVFDDGGAGLNMTTFVEARDALVYLGSPGNSNAIPLTSTTNRLENVLTGVTLELAGTSDQPVRLTVSRNLDSVVKQMKSFVDSFNSVLTNIDAYTKYNSDTQEKGILFGDSSIHSVRARLQNLINTPLDVAGPLNRLSQIGFTYTGSGQLQFDEDKFRSAYSSNSAAVISLFTEKNQIPDTDPPKYVGGVAVTFSNALENLTDDYSGTITHVTNGIDSRSKLLRTRIDSMNKMLEMKRQRLERQFAAMETALASLQGQQNSLSSLAQIASSFSNKK